MRYTLMKTQNTNYSKTSLEKVFTNTMFLSNLSLMKQKKQQIYSEET